MAEVIISSRQVTRIAEEVGRQLEAGRDRQTRQFQERQLEAAVTTRPALAVVEVDGGRLRIRSGEGDGPGAHGAAWREDKIALLTTAARKRSATDPEPKLPACFRDPAYVEKLGREIGGVGSLGFVDPPSPTPEDAPIPTDPPPTRAPELLVRSYVATTRDSEAFGPMVAAEAHKRNFQAAASGAFVGDGAAWLWKLHRQFFPDFTAVVDFLHALSYVFAAARTVSSQPAVRWARYLEWAEACWQGRVAQVIEELRGFQEQLGPLSVEGFKEDAQEDPRQVLAKSVVYLEHNADRMDYPRYRREGLPTTSSHAESTVKIFNRRVKGTEKSWGEVGAEAMLQLRAAYLSEDGRLDQHQRNTPGAPYRNYKSREPRKAA
jgi:hypothetical protein